MERGPRWWRGNPAAFYAVPSSAVPSSAVPSTPSGAITLGAVLAAGAGMPTTRPEQPGLLPWLAFGNDTEGVEVRATFGTPAEVAWYPVETVSNSEAGFERQYQGSCLLLRWPLVLAPGESRTVGVRFDVTSTRDHLAGETAPRP